jgi:hypothetical protein
MSWSTCYNGSNNIHKELPPLMSDGRLFTQLDPNCEENDRLQKSLQIQNNYDYRQYLIKNAESLMNKNKMGCFMLNNDFRVGEKEFVSHNKYVFNNVHDNNQPFGYEKSDLKNIYLSRQQLNAKKQAPFVRFK